MYANVYDIDVYVWGIISVCVSLCGMVYSVDVCGCVGCVTYAHN